MTDEKLQQEVTKHNFRKKIWDHMTKNELVNFPLNVYQRIPNFKGASEAAQRLSELEEFQNAKTILISPDKPQESVRFLALENDKEILVPIPRLKSGGFLHVKPIPGAAKDEIKRLSRTCVLQEPDKPIDANCDIKVDIIVLGSVCVSQDGYRLGRGKGFADLEFAIMAKMGAVTENTTIITTIHDCQIVDNLPTELFKEYDVPVDIIVTPTQTIIVNPKLKKPTSIMWHLLSEWRLKTMQILQELKEIDEKNGKVVTLKEVDSETETQRYFRDRSSYIKNKKRYKPRKVISNIDGNVGEEKSEDHLKSSSNRRSHRRLKAKNENPSPNVESLKTEGEIKNVPRYRRKSRPRSRSQVEFSLKLSNIMSTARVRDLKNALLERGVKPSEITWRGWRGVCYLHFNKLRNENTSPTQPIQVDSIMANLQQLRIGESVDNNDFIIVEPAKPISRIEVTDVTTI